MKESITRYAALAALTAVVFFAQGPRGQDHGGPGGGGGGGIGLGGVSSTTTTADTTIVRGTFLTSC